MPESGAPDARVVVPIVAERVDIEKRTVTTDLVRITKSVRDQIVVDEPVLVEEVVVERVPIDRVVDGPIPDRYEGETLIVSVVEEVPVVERRLRLTEELRITKRRRETRRPQEVTVRGEHVVVDRIESQSESRRGGDR